ncbi:hypothetical protein BDK51DRAFT_46528 [Blyttiomyces helicus]|uniref:DNA helicase n=1 Tax=Blyttiomyces helicus TaxID=388810 RepID=A0A4P9VVN2_9FUNG|nr:hypothetical protein BDK51DRAFT_46528 [Blyttiomyces helicus]|eukprot:RKO83719.1 hypothetical protein BDK51DRAFT_46528 [Blyttiomyces helicus]
MRAQSAPTGSLVNMDAALRFSNGLDKWFGNSSIIFIGDFLLIVSMHSHAAELPWHAREGAHKQQNVIHHFRSIPEATELTEVHRQQDPEFIQLLEHLRERTLTKKDKASISNLQRDPAKLTRGAWRSRALIFAHHNNHTIIHFLPRDEYVVNKSTYIPMFPPAGLLLCAESLQMIDEYLCRRPDKLSNLPNSTFVLTPSTTMFHLKTNSPRGTTTTITIRRTGFQNIPSLAITVNKAQGLTVQQAILDLSIPRGPFESNSIYVMNSRTFTPDGIAILPNFDPKILSLPPPKEVDILVALKH